MSLLESHLKGLQQKMIPTKKHGKELGGIIELKLIF